LKTVNFRRAFIIAALASLLLVYALLWLRMITTPVEYTGADFIAFYAAGRIAQAEGPGRVYDLARQQKVEEEVVGFAVAPEHISPYLHPPFVVPLAQALALDDFILSFVLWDGVMLAFLALGAFTLFRLLKEGLARREKWLLFAGLLLFFPGYAGLVIGQDSAMFAFCASLWLFGLLAKKDWLAGLGLAGMTLRPHLALPLALPFLFKRRGVWWWFALGAAALALFSLAYVGVDGIAGFLRVLLVSGRGRNYHTGEEHMFNTIGVLWRAFPNASPLFVHGAAWSVYLAAILGLCVLWAKAPQLEERRIGLAVLASLFTSPHTHIQDLILLLIPLVGLMLVLVRENYMQPRSVILLPLAASLIMLFSFFAEALKYGVYYLVVLVLLAALAFPDRIFPRLKRAAGRVSTRTTRMDE
jgi:hypothetical protein